MSEIDKILIEDNIKRCIDNTVEHIDEIDSIVILWTKKAGGYKATWCGKMMTMYGAVSLMKDIVREDLMTNTENQGK